jgi:hypothetical protein
MPVRESDFDSELPEFLTGEQTGRWTIADGYLVGSGLQDGLSTEWGGNIAYTTSDVRIAAGKILEIETTLAAGSSGGVVFDLYGKTDFKFVHIDENGQVSIGHQSGSEWGIEASAEMPAQVKGDYDIKVSLVGSTVTVIIDNQTVLSYAYNALTGDGAIGLLASGDNVGFENILISTNDPAYLDAITEDALRAAGETTTTSTTTLDGSVELELQSSSNEDPREYSKHLLMNGISADFSLLSSYLEERPMQRVGDISSDLLSSMVDANKRIVPVNLGMFEAVQRQVPWGFQERGDTAAKHSHAMLWNEEAGEFEPAQPVLNSARGDTRFEVMEFLEETGDWLR